MTAAVTVTHAPNRLRSVVRAPVDLAPGDRVRGHTIVRRLGRGGFGEVFEVARAGGGRAAMKVLHGRHAASRELRLRFEREVAVALALRHPNVVELYECGETDDGRPFFLMELLDGSDLQTELGRRGRFQPGEVAGLMGPLCSALDAAHAAGIVHRDIKPSNIVVTPAGRVVLLDFGIARPVHGPALTRSAQRLGTPHCMSPEQILNREVDARTDVYQLGVLAFQLLTGRPPFVDASVQDVHAAHLRAAREAPSRYVAAVPPAVDAVVVAAMSIDPAYRPGSAGELHRALAAAVSWREPPRDRPSIAFYVEVVEGDADLSAWRGRLAQLGLPFVSTTDNSLFAVAPRDEQLVTRLVELAREVRATCETAEVRVHAGAAVWQDDRPSDGRLLTLDWVTGVAGLHVTV